VGERRLLGLILDQPLAGAPESERNFPVDFAASRLGR